VSSPTLQCKEHLEVARAQQTACGSEADADFHIFCALEVKHALDELVSLVGEGDTLQRNIDSIQEKLDYEIVAKKNIQHDYHAALAQYYAADKKMISMRSSQQNPCLPAKTSEVLHFGPTIPGFMLTLTYMIQHMLFLFALIVFFPLACCTHKLRCCKCPRTQSATPDSTHGVLLIFRFKIFFWVNSLHVSWASTGLLAIAPTNPFMLVCCDYADRSEPAEPPSTAAGLSIVSDVASTPTTHPASSSGPASRTRRNLRVGFSTSTAKTL
jgi:hypothetical protein